MHPAFEALLAVLAVSALSLIGAVSLLFRESALRRIVAFLVALSVGALFGGAFIHLLPEAFEAVEDPLFVSVAVSLGVLVFFILEKVLRWRHSHGVDEECVDTVVAHAHDKKHLGWLVFFGDGLHNALDGVVIAAAFLISTELGIATTLAVILHELPQEMGDFGLLLHAGWSRGRALLMNFASALFAVVGAVLMLWVGASETVLALASAFAAGGFIYIAGADLVPELNRSGGGRAAVSQAVIVGLGFALMFALAFAE